MAVIITWLNLPCGTTLRVPHTRSGCRPVRWALHTGAPCRLLSLSSRPQTGGEVGGWGAVARTADRSGWRELGMGSAPHWLTIHQAFIRR